MNLFAVTPTFQSARFAGWKTGATKLNGLIVPMRVQCWRSTLTMNLGVLQRADGILPPEEAWLCRRDVGSTLLSSAARIPEIR